LDHTEVAYDQSLNRCSSSNYDNAFVTFEAPHPPSALKKAAEKVERGNKLAQNKRKTIASSHNNGKDMAYT
jgi:hypothetical protein